MYEYDDRASPRRLYRDPSHAICCGVLAGIANYFGFRRGPTRILFVLATLFMPIFVLAYVIMAFVLKPMPPDPYRDVTVKEEKFWRSMRQSPRSTLSDVRYRFRQLDQRLQKMERYVTSPRFDLDREFEDLEREDRREPRAH